MQPVDIVQAYFDRVYGDRDVEAIRQLCADPYRRHEPAGEVHLLIHDDQIARVNGVIAGWTEALQMMGIGAKWRLYIPYQLAYGARGAGAAIGPYQALVFDVELLAIVS